MKLKFGPEEVGYCVLSCRNDLSVINSVLFCMMNMG